MALHTRLLAPPPRGRGHSCTIGLLLVELATQDRTDDQGDDYRALVGALANREWTATDLEKALREEGHSVNVRHIRPHRAGQCTTANCPNPNIGLL